jgi:hypothetical protein
MRKQTKPHDFFVYKSKPFRVLYLGGAFMVPNKSHPLWLFRQRNVARLMAAGNNCEYADFRDYARISKGAQPHLRSERSEQRKPVNHKRPTLEELA